MISTTSSSVLTSTYKISNKINTDKNIEILILDTLIQSLNVNETLFEYFIRVISECNEYNKHYILDLWIIYGVESINRCKSRIEILFKRKIQSGLIRESLLINSIKTHGHTLASYFNSLLSLATLLVRSSGQSLVYQKFGCLIYEIIFDEFKNPSLRQNIIGAIIMHSGSNITDEIDCSLNILVNLIKPIPSYENNSSNTSNKILKSSNKNLRAEILKPQLPFLNQLLDYMIRWNYSQIRKVYRILCTIVNQGDRSGKDQVNTVINKQLSHSNINFRYMGIIGKIISLELEMSQFDSENENNDNFTSENTLKNDEDDTGIVGDDDELKVGLPPDQMKIIEDILFDLSRACSRIPACQAFLFDEFTFAIQSNYFSKSIVELISEQFSTELESIFLDDYEPEQDKQQQYIKPILGASIRTSLWKNLDGLDASLYLTISQLTSSTDPAEKNSLCYLCPLLCLLSTCETIINGNLDAIDAVLGCPILLFEDYVYDEIDSLAENVQEVICLSLWHCINWCREIINAFCVQEDMQIQNKVVQRLFNLCELEKKLEKIVDHCPSFSPPGISKFPLISANVVSSSVLKGKTPCENGVMSSRQLMLKETYRSFHPEVAEILSFNALSSNNHVDNQINELHNDLMKIEILSVIQLLSDEVLKTLTKILTKKKKTSNFPFTKKPTIEDNDKQHSQLHLHHYDYISILELYNKKVFLALLKHIQYYCLKDSYVNIDNSENEKGMISSIVFIYFKCISTICQCDSLKSTKYGTTMQLNVLENLFLNKNEVNVDDNNGGGCEAINSFSLYFRKLTQFDYLVTNLENATYYVNVLESLVVFFDIQTSRIYFSSKIENHNSMRNSLCEIAKRLLHRNWDFGNDNKKKKIRYKTTNLQYFVQIFLKYSTLPLNSIEYLCIDAIEPFLQNRGITSPERFPTLIPSSFIFYYRPMLETITQCVSKLDFNIGINPPLFLLAYLSQAALLFKLLVLITKSFQKTQIVTIVLKQGRTFIETVLNAMPFFKHYFVEYNTEISEFFKDLQIITRRMQTLCAHGKEEKSLSSYAQVPIVKKILESFIYRVEILVQSHGIHAAYSTGILKQRRIDGSTINIQEIEEQNKENDDESSSTEDSDSSSTENNTVENDENEENSNEEEDADSENDE